MFSPFYEYNNLEYVHIHVIYRVRQAKYGIPIHVAASQEYVNTYSTRRVRSRIQHEYWEMGNHRAPRLSLYKIVFHQSFMVGVNLPFIATPHLQTLPYDNTIGLTLTLTPRRAAGSWWLRTWWPRVALNTNTDLYKIFVCVFGDCALVNTVLGIQHLLYCTPPCYILQSRLLKIWAPPATPPVLPFNIQYWQWQYRVKANTNTGRLEITGLLA